MHTDDEDDTEAITLLRELGPTLGEDIVEALIADNRVRSRLSGMSDEDASAGVRQLGDAMENRPEGLDPIADHSGYFLKILRRGRKGEGEVVGTLRELLSGTDAGEDMLEQILAHEELRATLRMLSRADGMDAVEKLGASLENDLDPIADDPGGYFLEMLSPYEKKEGGGNGRRNGRKGNRNKANAATSDANDDEADLSLEDQLRLAERRVGSFRSNWSRAEEKVVELEAKVEELTSELDRMKSLE